MSVCRQGCPTPGQHESYAACLRSANIRVGETINSVAQEAWEKTKRDLPAYATARANGIQPEGTTLAKVKAAESASRLLGRPYNAEKDPPASMIVNKNAARFVNTKDD